MNKIKYIIVTLMLLLSFNSFSQVTMTKVKRIKVEAMPKDSLVSKFVGIDETGELVWLNRPVTVDNKAKWYAENSTAPATAPLATGGGSIAMGNNAKAAGPNIFTYGTDAGTTDSNSFQSIFLGIEAGKGSSSLFNSTYIGAHSGINASNTASSVFIGNYAGSGAAGATASTFIGTAGQAATNATNSVFLGYGSGSYAANSSFSNFIGDQSGSAQSNSSYSNYLGFRAGSVSSGVAHIGNNNIVIGTNVTLPNGSTNAMNIGGVLFGTGFYYNITDLYANALPVAAGRIGIGTSTPTNTLHVKSSSNPLKLEGVNTATDTDVLTIDGTGEVHKKVISIAAQVQSDWNQATTSAVDYIKNKPTIPTGFVDLTTNQNIGGFKTFTSPLNVSGPITNTISYYSNPTVFGTGLSAAYPAIGGNANHIGLYSANGGAGGLVAFFNTLSLTGNRTFTMPNVSGIIPMTVNGTGPDVNGNIVISTGAAQVQSDWNAVSGLGVILNKPIISADTDLVHKAGSETIPGTKTFSGGSIIIGSTAGFNESNVRLGTNTTPTASSGYVEYGRYLNDFYLMSSGTGFSTGFKTSSLSAHRSLTMPDANGTVAIAVNGITPNVNGNIVIPLTVPVPIEYDSSKRTLWNNGYGDIPGNLSYGVDAMWSTGMTGINNMAIGNNTLLHITSGSNNSAVGYQALMANTTGTGNNAYGHQALVANTTGYNNTALGENSLYANTTGNYNTALGSYTLNNNLTGLYNLAVGNRAMNTFTDGYYNIGLGSETLDKLATGNSNIGIGSRTLGKMTAGSYNIALGDGAGGYITTGGEITSSSYSILIGNDITLKADTSNNEIVIGNSAQGKGNNSTQIGNSSTLNTYISGTLHIGGNDVAPASATATGVKGEIRVTSTYIYYCTATDTWVRSPLATW